MPGLIIAVPVAKSIAPAKNPAYVGHVAIVRYPEIFTTVEAKIVSL
jgi:hypothetical protein